MSEGEEWHHMTVRLWRCRSTKGRIGKEEEGEAKPGSEAVNNGGARRRRRKRTKEQEKNV